MFKSVLMFLGALLFLGACSDVALQSLQRAYPQFSLVGAPDRPVTFDLSIDGPGMDTIGPVEVGPEQRSTVLEIPAGRNREFSFVAQDDVYSGHAVASIAGGRETTVTVPIVPGPVFVDLDGGELESGPRVVQVRDLNVPSDSVESETDGRGRMWSNSQVLDAGYDTSGRLWLLRWFGEGPVFTEFYSSWGDAEPEPVESVSLEIGAGDIPTTAAVAVDYERIAVGGEAAGETGNAVSLFDFAGGALDLPEIEINGEPLNIPAVSGLAFDNEGSLWAVGFAFVDDEGSEGSGLTPVVVKYDPGVGVADYRLLPGDFFVPTPLRVPWADIAATDDGVFIASSTYPADSSGPNDINDLDHPVLYRYDYDMRLNDTWGRRSTLENVGASEFWGPRRFAATRNPEQLIVIDQKDAGEFDNLDGTGRLVEFEFGTTNGWQEFGRGEYELFDTTLDLDGGGNGNGEQPAL